MKDIIIIGAGPAGMSAAIYGMRAGLDLLLLERYAPGGQVMNTYEVENYPGFIDPVAGYDLVAAMEGQARRLGADIQSVDVTSFKKDPAGHFIIQGGPGELYQSKAVILAMGSSYRRMGVPGESEFIGKGVSYCATCDGAFFKDKVTAVIGGGNTAIEEALFLTRFASKVYIIHRRDGFRADKMLLDRARSHEKIEMLCCNVVTKINGSSKVDSATLRDLNSSTEIDLPLDGVFIFIGYNPNTALVPKDLLNDAGQVRVTMSMSTDLPGLFAAGDIRSHSKRQIVMAAADGATAAMSAYEYLNHL